jgi:hypothetical protein
VASCTTVSRSSGANASTYTSAFTLDACVAALVIPAPPYRLAQATAGKGVRTLA